MTEVSVPLRGLWFLSNWIFTLEDLDGRFRPLTGIMVLIAKRDDLLVPGALRFRPLTGIMVLIGLALFAVVYFICYVSVPLRGLWFLSRRAGSGDSTSR